MTVKDCWVSMYRFCDIRLHNCMPILFSTIQKCEVGKAVCKAATINQFQGIESIDSFVQETYEHQKSRSEKAPKRCFDEKKPIGKSRLEKAQKKAGCTGVFSAVPNVPTPKSELVKKFHGAFYELGQSAHRQRTIFSFDSFLSLFDNHFESIVFTFAYNR